MPVGKCSVYTLMLWAYVGICLVLILSASPAMNGYLGTVDLVAERIRNA